MKNQTTSSKASGIFVVLFLLLPPALLCLYWYEMENEEIRPFSNLEVGELRNISPEMASSAFGLTKDFYNLTKNDFPVKFSEEKSITDFDNFNSNISNSITEKLGVFSYLPYHKICLINRNSVFVNNTADDTLSHNRGSVAIRQENGYNFYAERGGADCKNVSISKFRQASSSPEIGYVVAISVNKEENEKRLAGEDYLVDIAPTSVKATETSLRISLNCWVVVLAYFLFLFAWSFIFFQFEKIVLKLKDNL